MEWHEISSGTAARLSGWDSGTNMEFANNACYSGGGAALTAVDALRAGGLICETAVCVVDREEGGGKAMAAKGVSLEPLFRLDDIRKA